MRQLEPAFVCITYDIIAVALVLVLLYQVPKEGTYGRYSSAACTVIHTYRYCTVPKVYSYLYYQVLVY